MAAPTGSAYLNIALIKSMIRQAEEDTLDEVGELIATDARRRAPIRKAFKERPGFRRKFRALTEGEKSQAIARANNYYGSIKPDEFKRRRAIAHIQNYARVQIPRRGSANALVASRELRFLGIESYGRFRSNTGATRVVSRRTGTSGFNPGPEASAAMTSRGRSEARTGHSIYREETGAGTKVHVGGSLKASIESDGATQKAGGMSVTVAARIRYAKFVEFPTVRTAAQPFLLPALHAQRERLTGLFAANLRKVFGGR